MRRRTICMLMGSSMVAFGGLSQGAPPSETTQKDVLKGPSAEPHAPPTSPGVFGDPGESRPGRGAMNTRARYELFQRALATLMNGDAPPSLRLDEAQSEGVRTIQHEFRQANEAFYREHQDELRLIREQTGDRGPARATPRPRDGAPATDKRGDAPSEGVAPARRRTEERPAGHRPADEMTPDAREDLMRRLRELEEARPDPGPYQARVWELLRAEQRAHVTKEMERESDEIAKRRGEERLKKEREDRGATPAKRPDGAAPGKPGAAERGKRPQDRVRERKGADAPAPGVDQVNVPRP